MASPRVSLTSRQTWRALEADLQRLARLPEVKQGAPHVAQGHGFAAAVAYLAPDGQGLTVEIESLPGFAQVGPDAANIVQIKSFAVPVSGIRARQATPG